MLRQQTVETLTGSFTFLQKRAPSVLSRDGVREPIPSSRAGGFLRRAEASEDAPRGAVDEVRRRVIEDAAPASVVTRAYRDVVFPIDEGARRKRDTAGVRNVARRLRELLVETRAVPTKFAGEVTRALARLLAAIGETDEEAS